MTTLKLSTVRKEVLSNTASEPQRYHTLTGTQKTAARWLDDNGYAKIDWEEGVCYLSITPAGKAALGISDEPQPAVAVETPAAQDSDYQPMVGDVIEAIEYPEYGQGVVETVYEDSSFLAYVKWSNGRHINITRKTKVQLVERPTIAAVAITDDSAVDNTPSEQKANDGQPSIAKACPKCNAPMIEIEPVDEGDDADLKMWQCTKCANITMNYAEYFFGEGYEWQGGLIASRIKSGWVADALATVNVTSEAVANDDYLPPTVEDNDDLPFSDLGEDEYWIPDYKYDWKSMVEERDTTITSLEARVKELETALRKSLQIAELAAYYLPGELGENQHQVFQDLSDAQAALPENKAVR